MKVIQLTLAASLLGHVLGHGYLSSPLPRQYREEGLDGIGWTKWMGITIPGDGSFNPGEGNAPNLNAGIGGGYDGAQRELSVGHGLCGDLGERNGFAEGPYGRTAPRTTVEAGGVLPVSVKITAYHAGWFEFRLCAPDASGQVTQQCLNEHVLEIDSSTPYYPDILDYANMKGIDALGNGGWYKCSESGGFSDPTSLTPNTVWPSGSCCNNGGVCSDPMNNKDRYVIEYAGGGGVRDYEIMLKIPHDMECEGCILQWFYQTANSREAYPESFWNCADIAVSGGGTATTNTGAPTAATVRPTTTSPTTASGNTSPTAAPATEDGCEDIYQGCYAHWCSDAHWNSQCQKTCGSCSSGGGGDDSSTTPSTTSSPTANSAISTGSPTAGVTNPPTTKPSSGECEDIHDTCYAHWCSDAYWNSQCQKTCGSCSSGGGGDDSSTTPSTTSSPTTNSVSSTGSPTAGVTNPSTFSPTPVVTGDDQAAGWKRVMSPELIAKGHPWGISNFGSGLSGQAAAEVIFEDIATALQDGPAEFASFCNSGDVAADRREAAAFLANVLKETGGYSAFVEVSPHGTYCTYNGEGGSDLQQAGLPYPCGPSFPEYADAFIGRGAIQLTWNINYGRFSEFYFGDKDVLLKNPELVEGDGPLGWAASLWFWMQPQDFGGQCPPKQLDSSMPLGHMSCHQAMANADGGGMGQTIRIINGGYESCPTSSYRSSAVARMQDYLALTSLLDVAPAADVTCRGGSTTIEGCDVSGMKQYDRTEGTIGNPLIGEPSSSECPQCRVVECTSQLKSKWLGTYNDPVDKLEWTCV